MGLYRKETLEFVRYLNANRSVSGKIRAARDKTLVYAGDFGVRPIWREIRLQQRSSPELRDKELLPEVLARVATPGTGYANLLEYIEDLTGKDGRPGKVPWKPDGFKLWRVVSGIFAANAIGKVSFQIGTGVKPSDKVFASTEVRALMKNPNIDPVAKDLLAYYERCISSGVSDIGVGFVSA
jgi:hypothetical protein